jgi:hypothetical protein
MYKDPPRGKLKAEAGRKFLVKHFKLFFEFTTPNFRQNGDASYHAICQQARKGLAPTPKMLEQLNSRLVAISTAREQTTPSALWTATTHAVKDSLSEDYFKELKAAGNTIVNVYAKHRRLVNCACVGKRKRNTVAPHNYIPTNDDPGDIPADIQGITTLSGNDRRALVKRNPFLNDVGSRKKEQSKFGNALPPTAVLPIGGRVKLLRHVAKDIGLIKGARGTIIQILYSQRPAEGPALPSASFEQAVSSERQLQVPLVLVQFDATDYIGGSFSLDIPRLVPIAAMTSRFTMHGRDYEREMLPLEVSLADTIHTAQGCTAFEHVMSAPGSKYANFARGLMYVALSRSTNLMSLFLIHHKITAEMFTKWAAETAQIDAEYTRLRALPHWRRLPENAGAEETPTATATAADLMEEDEPDDGEADIEDF